MHVHQHAAAAERHAECSKPFPSTPQIHCPASSLRDAHWQMSLAFTRFWLASSTSLLPPACVTSALTSHVTSGRTSEGIPVAGQTSDDLQRVLLPNGGKTHFLDVIGLEIKLQTERERERLEQSYSPSHTHIHIIIGKGKFSPRIPRLPETPGSYTR